MMAATRPSRELCIMACVFCKDLQFRTWLGLSAGLVASEGEAKATMMSICNIASRNELDSDERAAGLFHSYIRLPFLAWKEGQS